ncbi:hypothetical protein [Archangium lipolyticum]|uniref:hypothetical protein n=1 Tax=Archangium lipolyticum TaxID=2970465 RepID=UPI00214A6276|nr:hypothetical protein [Archangium lipolyticum]
MSRLRAVVAALTLGAPFVATAADITRVASSFEDDDPFGMFIDVGVETTQRRTKIVRESLPTTAEGKRYANALWYRGADPRLNFDLAIGISRDVELSFGVPIVFVRTEKWDFVSDSNSTILNNTIGNNCADGEPCTLPSAQPLFNVPLETLRGGVGNMRFGLAWAIFNQRKDDTKPMWVVGLDYEAPTAAKLDPSVPTDSEAENARNIGDRVHKYTMYTALSRKIGIADPYFRMHYTVPVRGPGFYSNCDQKNLDPQNLGRPQNCGIDEWDRKTTGIQAPHTGGLTFGSEFHVYNQPNRKVWLDLRAITNYVSEGRYYNELSGALRKLLYTGDYMQVGGQLALKAHVNDVLTLRGSAMLLYNTDHVLTDEQIGKDIDKSGTVDITTNPAEINPNFDYRTDFVSRRFYATESKDFRLELSATFSF